MTDPTAFHDGLSRVCRTLDALPQETETVRPDDDVEDLQQYADQLVTCKRILNRDLRSIHELAISQRQETPGYRRFIGTAHDTDDSTVLLILDYYRDGTVDFKAPYILQNRCVGTLLPHVDFDDRQRIDYHAAYLTASLQYASLEHDFDMEDIAIGPLHADISSVSDGLSVTTTDDDAMLDNWLDDQYDPTTELTLPTETQEVDTGNQPKPVAILQALANRPEFTTTWLAAD